MENKTSVSKIILTIINVIIHIFLNILFYTFVIILITKLSVIAYDFSYQIFGNVSVEEAPGRDISIEIKSGESTMNIANKLELNRLIVNKYSFYLRAKLTKQVIMPGTYVINTSMDYDQIFSVITDLSESEKKE